MLVICLKEEKVTRITLLSDWIITIQKTKTTYHWKAFPRKKKLINDDDIYSNMVNGKSTKLLIAGDLNTWPLKTLRHYSGLTSIEKISMNIAVEVKHIKTKFLKAVYPLLFMDRIIRKFCSTVDVEYSLIIAPSFFFLYKWVLHGLTKNTVTCYLHPGTRERKNTKINKKINKYIKINKYLVDMHI